MLTLIELGNPEIQIHWKWMWLQTQTQTQTPLQQRSYWAFLSFGYLDASNNFHGIEWRNDAFQHFAWYYIYVFFKPASSTLRSRAFCTWFLFIKIEKKNLFLFVPIVAMPIWVREYFMIPEIKQWTEVK